MSKTGIDYLTEQLKMSSKVIGEFDKQMGLYEDVKQQMIDSVPDSQRAELDLFIAMSNKAIKKAKDGDSTFEDVVNNMKEQFKNKETDGSNNNG